MSHDHPRFCDPDYEPYPVRTDDYDGPDYQSEVLAEEEALKREEQAPAQEMSTAIENEERNELKPCPWCGVVPEVKQDFDNEWYVSCVEEECSMSVNTGLDKLTREQAIERWNRRQP